MGTNFDIDASGIIGGGQAGFNYQTGPWVIGVEGSVAGSDLDGTIRSPFFPTSDSYSADVDFLTTVGRIGYAQGKWRLGWSRCLANSVRPWDPGARQLERLRQWLDGGGGEYAICRNVSLGVEYDYSDLDQDRWRISCPTCPSGVGGGVPVVAATSRCNR